MQKIIVLLFIAFALASNAQSYSGPESVEFDYANNRWLIGNKNNGTVIARDMNGVFTPFVSGMSSGPYGIEILGNTLYCCHNGGSIRGFDLATGAQVFNLNLGATFLNGICTDGVKNLYVTDFTGKKIYRVNVSDSSFNVFVTGLAKSPNGIIYEGANQRLVFVNWGTNAPIQQVNLSDSLVSTLLTTTLTNLDGIAADLYGNYYVSTWGTQTVRKFSNNFTSGPTTVVTGLTSPADMFYNTVTDTLAIPNSGTANNVIWVGFGTTGVDETNKTKSAIQLFPQPASTGNFTVLADEAVMAIRIYDLGGKSVFTEKDVNGFLPSKKIELQTKLRAGQYLVELQFVKGKKTIPLIISEE